MYLSSFLPWQVWSRHHHILILWKPLFNNSRVNCISYKELPLVSLVSIGIVYSYCYERGQCGKMCYFLATEILLQACCSCALVVSLDLPHFCSSSSLCSLQFPAEKCFLRGCCSFTLKLFKLALQTMERIPDLFPLCFVWVCMCMCVRPEVSSLRRSQHCILSNCLTRMWGWLD